MAPKPLTTAIKLNDSQQAQSETVSTTSSQSSSSRPGRRTRRSKSSKQSKKEKLAYNYDSHLTHINAKPIYGVAFYQTPLQQGDKPQYIFATAGGTCCMVYECLQPTGMRLLMTFMDPHKKENFHTCAWMYGAPIIAVAGQNGIIRLLSVSKAKLAANLTGHAGPINDLKFHPTREYLLMSASKDYSVRLWNIKTRVMVAMFSGVDGHRDEIVSVDFHYSGKYILSCGIDHAIKIWSLEECTVREAIAESYNYKPQNAERNFATVRQHFPLYSRSDVHDNYVDCVQWFHDFILSKACENVIVCWKPGDVNTPITALAKEKPKGKTILKLFEYKNCDVWFIRFAFHPKQHILALGNQVGDVNIWEFDPANAYKTHLSVLKHPQSTTVVRQVAMSRDANILVYVCEDGSVWRWNRNDPIKQGC